MVAAVVLLLPPAVIAQTEAEEAASPWPVFDLERLELNPGAEGSLVLGMGELLPAGHHRLSAAGHYAHRPLLLSREGEVLTVVGSRATTHIAAAYAPVKWLQVGVQVPVVAMQRGADLSEQGHARPASFGLGTPMVAVRWGALTQEDSGVLDVAVEGAFGLPVGSGAGLSRDDGLRYSPKLMVGRHFGALRAGVEAGLVVKPTVELLPRGAGVESQVGKVLQVGAALGTTGRRLRWELNVKGTVPLTDQPGAAELLPGARYLVSTSLEVFALAGVGVGKAPGTPTFRLLVGGAFGRVVPHRGPGESSATCDPGLPHTIEECPDMDEDQDGVANAADGCPEVPGTAERKGCPRSDSDNDGIEDGLDACPAEPGLAALQGCQVSDKDKDGTPDEQDSCPGEAGPADNRGCPLKDRDKDGIENDQDQCPDEPGPPERNGCPEEDTDKDGIPNRIDSCTGTPGVETNLGCPMQEVPQVEITHRELRLRGKVYFEAAQARIQSRSYEVLDWVAKVLREHPEIPRVMVGAHTDDRGFAEENKRLSQQRAEAVRRYLVDKGVPLERLEARGYGQERPIDVNDTSIGRENNRRVDFFILREEQGNDNTGAPRPGAAPQEGVKP
jgi:outer membrane protein OmpA-like peptidoglycan-associated protein